MLFLILNTYGVVVACLPSKQMARVQITVCVAKVHSKVLLTCPLNKNIFSLLIWINNKDNTKNIMDKKNRIFFLVFFALTSF